MLDQPKVVTNYVQKELCQGRIEYFGPMADTELERVQLNPLEQYQRREGKRMGANDGLVLPARS